MWLRTYGQALEADLYRFYGMDLLDYYRGRMSTRRLWVLANNLPPESTTVHLSRQEAPEQPAERHLAPVKCLADIPVAGSLQEAGSFVQASPDEFAEKAG